MGEKGPVPSDAIDAENKDEKKPVDEADEYTTFTDSRGGVHRVKKSEKQQYIDDLREADRNK